MCDIFWLWLDFLVFIAFVLLPFLSLLFLPFFFFFFSFFKDTIRSCGGDDEDIVGSYRSERLWKLAEMIRQDPQGEWAGWIWVSIALGATADPPWFHYSWHILASMSMWRADMESLPSVPLVSSCVREMLKDSRVKVNEPTNDGWTPLCVAARYGHLDAIRWWIAFGREMDLGKPGDVARRMRLAWQGMKSERIGNQWWVLLLLLFHSISIPILFIVIEILKFCWNLPFTVGIVFSHRSPGPLLSPLCLHPSLCSTSPYSIFLVLSTIHLLLRACNGSRSMVGKLFSLFSRFWSLSGKRYIHNHTIASIASLGIPWEILRLARPWQFFVCRM